MKNIYKKLFQPHYIAVLLLGLILQKRGLLLPLLAVHIPLQFMLLQVLWFFMQLHVTQSYVTPATVYCSAKELDAREIAKEVAPPSSSRRSLAGLRKAFAKKNTNGIS